MECAKAGLVWSLAFNTIQVGSCIPGAPPKPLFLSHKETLGTQADLSQQPVIWGCIRSVVKVVGVLVY